ncbi:MAG TPA: hypothetical protein VHR45_24780 [Thermoanaerobaculia bacterium]|nr:hypothetical protein [Thermoanaerobaculia bacterium]
MSPETQLDSTSRKAFITTLVAILLNPVSVATGYLLSHWFAAPKWRIATISRSYTVEDHMLDAKIVAALNDVPGLSANLRDTITRNQAGTAEGSCVTWLDGEPWEDRCLATVKQAVFGILGAQLAEKTALEANINALEQSHALKEPTLQPMAVVRIEIVYLQAKTNKAAAIAMLRGPLDMLVHETQSLKALQNALSVMEKNSDMPRTGEMSFPVGVLNAGDTDGVISNRAHLKFNGMSLWLSSESFTNVKGHSFQEIEFTPRGSDSDTDGALDKWKEIVRSKKEQPFEMILTAENRTIPKSEVLNSKD